MSLTIVFCLLFSLSLALPPGLSCTQSNYKNWAQQISCNPISTCTVNTPADVITASNWAKNNNYKIRPSGSQHGWAPWTVTTNSSSCATNILLLKTAKLNAMSIASTSPPAVQVQTGATMDSLLTFLENNGYGFLATPAPGDITIGGVLAINGHGTGIPATGETKPVGATYGSLSNLIVQFTAVVWNATANSFQLQTFSRSHPDSSAFLTSLGRSFLVDVQLRVIPNYNMSCVSRTDLTAAQLFAQDGPTNPNTFANFVRSSGRAELILFPFTTKAWLKVWTVAPTKPLLARQVFAPYNYVFSDVVPTIVSNLAGEIVSGAYYLAPVLGLLQYTTSAAGLVGSSNLWGKSKNVLLYIKPTTLRLTANGYAIFAKRSTIQSVVHPLCTYYLQLLEQYKSRNLYPINGPIEIRVTGLDEAADVGVVGAKSPSLSAAAPIDGDFDCVVWFDLLTFPNTPSSPAFFRDIESFILTNFPYSRVEWSKGWGYTATQTWANSTVLGTYIPGSFGSNWTWAIDKLNSYDPHRVFTNSFIDNVLV